MTNPYETPEAPVSSSTELRYVGFWARTLASLIDTVLILIITMPALYFVYGSEFLLGDQFLLGAWDFVINYVFPAVAVILFWRYKSATPGKMIIGARIVDAKTAGKPSTGQLIGRYFAYVPAILAFGLGILWVAWDPRKQGWHDKLAGTLVVKGG